MEKKTIDVYSKRMVTYLGTLGYQPSKVKEIDKYQGFIWTYDKVENLEECISFYKWHWEKMSKDWDKKVPSKKSV